MSAQGTTFSPLTHRLFSLLLAANLSANLANAIQGVGAQWLMTAIDGRADMVALVQTATTAPIMLFALFGGAIADIFDRRAVMLTAQIAVGCASLLLAVLAYTGDVTPWVLIALTFALGTGIAFYNPIVAASIATIVPRAEISGAVGLNVIGFNLARTVGPAVGGAIVALAGAFAAFALSACMSLLSAAVLWNWRSPHVAATGRNLSALFPAIVEGLRCVRDTPQLRAVALRALLHTGFGSALWALMPLVARDLVGGGAESFGFLLASLGGGALLGAAFSHEVRRRFSAETVARAAAFTFGIAALVIVSRPGFAISCFVLVVGGALWVQALSGFSVSAQMWAPRQLVGRVTSTVSMAVWGGLALGSWLWGHVAEWAGLPTAIIVSGAAMVALGIFGILLPLPRNEDAPEPVGAGK